MRVLIVEDDHTLRGIITKRLKASGYAVDDCDNGPDGLSFAQSADYDVILLDVMLPGMSGLEIVKSLRSKGSRSNVLLLTARDSIEDRVIGLDCGADDYLVKPFAFDELLARLRVLLRRKTADHSPVLELADLTMDTAKHTVCRAGAEIELTLKEYSLLEYLFRNAGSVLTRTQIIDHVWNFDCDIESNLVDVYIRYLRSKIDKDHPVKLLHTVRGFGYVLKAGES